MRKSLTIVALYLFSGGSALAETVSLVVTDNFNSAFSLPLTYRDSQPLGITEAPGCFDSPDPYLHCSLVYSGPRISAVQSQIIGEVTPNGTYGVRSSYGGANGWYTLQLDFNDTSQSYYNPQVETDFVSVDIGGANMDADVIFLEAYDASSNLLTSNTLNIASGFTGFLNLAVAVEGIDHVLFGTRNGSFFYADNISFATEVQVVPIPAAVWLFVSALAGLGFLRRRIEAT